MVPRPEIKAIEIDSRREDVLEIVRSAGYSRYPVYRGRLDSIEGIIHGKDIITYLIDNKEFAVKDVLRKAFFVPEFASLEKVLLQMQEKAVHMALVVDEFGNVDGLVTLEDIIEEIVGEIQDEHDDQAEDLAHPARRRRCTSFPAPRRPKRSTPSSPWAFPRSPTTPPWPGSSSTSSGACPTRRIPWSTAASA